MWCETAQKRCDGLWCGVMWCETAQTHGGLWRWFHGAEKRRCVRWQPDSCLECVVSFVSMEDAVLCRYHEECLCSLNRIKLHCRMLCLALVALFEWL